MREFIRLQLKLKWGLNRNNGKASAIMTCVATFIAVLIALALVYTLSYVLKTSISVAARRLSVLFLTLILFGLTIASTGMQMKRLYRPGDLLITARFPLSPFKLFMSYLILNYIDLTIYSAILLLPVMIVFGIAMNSLTFLYFVGVIICTLLMPLIPFGLSIFIAIPAMYITTALERHGIVRLVLFVILLVGAFLIYNYLLTVLAEFFIHRDWEKGTLEIWEAILKALDYYYNPAFYLSSMVFFDRILLGIGAYVGAGAILITGGVFLARAVCSSVRKKALDSGNDTYLRRTSTDGYGDTRAIFRYTFREILRTKTYSYFYLGVAISTPVMVFFCSRLVSMVGEAQVGVGINFGASMLVVAIFMAMISSFAGTILSVEGKNFYITKLVPVSYRKQLVIKALLSIGVSAVALLISAIVIGILEFITVTDMLILVLTQLMLASGLVFNGVNLNLANPNLKPKANGEAEEINITFMLLIGLAIAAIFGACCILFPKIFENGKLYAYLTAVGITFVYAMINILVFIFTADKKYRKIEP